VPGGGEKEGGGRGDGVGVGQKRPRRGEGIREKLG